jgi:hypothetical protein
LKVLVMTLLKDRFVGNGIAALLVAASLCALPAWAGMIVPAAVPSGPGLGFVSVPAIFTLTPNNDNVPAPAVPDNNIVVPLKRFDFNDYIDIEFVVVPTGGVTEYQVTEFVDNNTGTDWSEYRMQLGFGVGPGFVVGPPADGLDFDAPTFDTPPTSGALPVVVPLSEDELSFSGGIHGGGAQPYMFRIDVPDGPLGVTYTFTLRQFPTPVPEPSTAVLVALAVVGLLRRRR